MKCLKRRNINMVIYAPAKVNLRLRILGKRPDGYHNIETVFERIALSDKIVLRSLKSDKIKLLCNRHDVPLGKDSLIYRTISLFKRRKKVTGGIEVKIFKRIPIASGLGGGSSDVASILTCLNKLWRPFLGLPALLEFGRKLGADVPFFLKNCSFAVAKGRGDKIMPLGWKIKFWHLLVSPPVKLLSKDIYAGTETSHQPLNLFPSPPPLPFGERVWMRGLLPDSYFINDLEHIVLEKAPLVVKFKNALKNIGLAHSLVSGSGPSIFSLFAKRKEAIGAKELLIKRFPLAREKGCQIFIVPTL